MLTRKHFLNVIVLGVPLLAGMVSEFFMYLADSAMVGRLGTEYLAAMAIATLFAEIMWVLVWPFAPGTQALAARRYGRQKADTAIDAAVFSRLQRATGDVLDNAMVVSFIVGVAVIVAASFSLHVLRLLLCDLQLAALANAYIRIIKWVMPVAGIFYAMYGFLAAVNLTHAIMVATVGLNLLNILFNYLLIFGKFGFPALGIAGAAIGTLLAHVLGTAYLAGYLFFSKSTRGYRCGRFNHLKWRLVKNIIIASWPMIVQLGIVLSIYLYYESIIADIGITELAVTHIIFTMFILNRTLVGGFAEGGSALIGNHLGRCEPEEALCYGYATECIAFLFGVVLVVLILLFPQRIVEVFNREPETVALGVDGLRFFTFFIFVNIVGYPLETIFTHNGWGKYPLVAELISIVIFTLGLTLILVRCFEMGIYAAWLSMGLYTICYTLLLAGGFGSKRWLAVDMQRDMDVSYHR